MRGGVVRLLGLVSSSVLLCASSQELKFDDVPEVRSGKDASPFLRDGGGEDPQSLVLQEENLFITVSGVALEDEDGTPAPNTTEIVWEVIAGGKVFPQEPVLVDNEGKFFLASENGFTDDVNWVNVKDRGDQDITVVASFVAQNGELVTKDTTNTMYVISNFESIFPLLALVILSLLSRNVYVSMFFGIWIGSLIIEGGDIANSFRELFDRHIIPSITDDFNFRTITFTLFLAGFIAMIKHSGGQEGFSLLVARYATTAKSTQLAAVGAGVGLFFDDYSSALILGSSFKKLTDAFYVSREKLAFVVDSTSAPIASLAPISSWIAFELSRIKPELDGIVDRSEFVEEAKALPGEYTFFLNTIPSRYYPFFMLVIQVVLIVSAVEFGPMLFAERATRFERRTDGGDGATDIALEADLTNPEPDTPKKAWNFFIPLAFFITTLLVSLVNVGADFIDFHNGIEYEVDKTIDKNAREIFGNTNSFVSLVYATMGSSLFALVFYLFQTKKDGEMVLPTKDSLIETFDCRLKKADDVAAAESLDLKEAEDEKLGGGKAKPLMAFTEGVNVWVEGFKNLVPAILILCMAFTIKSVVKGAAADRFFTDIILNGDLEAQYLPTIIFFVASLLSLCTGTSFGTMSIMFPLVSFATWEKSEGDEKLFTVALSSIMAGAIFGDHSSLISDTTILSSIGAGCSIGTHVYTQMPYALWGALFAMIFGTLPAGAGADAVAMLFIGGLALTAATLLMGAPIVSKSGRVDRFTAIYAWITKSDSIREHQERAKEFADANAELIDPEPFEAMFNFGRRLMGRGPIGADDETESLAVAEAGEVKEEEKKDEKKEEEGAPAFDPMDI